MKHNICKRVLSVIFVIILVISTLPIDASFLADVHNGIGIYNHIYSDDEDPVNNKYRLTFYSNGIPVTGFPEFDVPVEGGDVVIVGTDGKFTVPPNKTVCFTDNTDFINFINEHNVDRIDFDFVEDDEENEKKYYLYTPDSPYTQTIERVDEHGDPIEFNKDDYSAVEFKSTSVIEYTVNKEWHDRGGTTRPEPNDITFTIRQSTDPNQEGEVFTPVNGDPNITTINSNHFAYEYQVPEFDENGNRYYYTSSENFPPDKEQYYRHEPLDSNTNTYKSVGLTDFNCELSFIDAAHSDARHSVDASFINTYFDLCDENDAVIDVPDENIVITPIEGTSGGYELKITGLDDISATGHAKSYYLKRKGENETTLPVKESASYSGHEEDWYALQADNIGVNSADTERTFESGTLQLRLKGRTDFNGTVTWEDIETAQERRQTADPGFLTLWRYVDNIEKSAQVDTQNLRCDEDSYSFSFDGDNNEGYEKYDILGREYTYYVKEKLNTIADKTYAVEYNNDSQAVFLLDGQTVKNKLSDFLTISVDTKWIAAARQGGEANATYELRRKKSDGTWETVETVTVNGFSAEEMEKFKEFAEVPMYDEHGRLYEYDVVQTHVDRTDNGTNGEYNSEINQTNAPSSGTLLDIALGKDNYYVTVEKDENQFKFVYQIHGDAELNIEKVWADADTVDHTGDTVEIHVEQYVYDGSDKGYKKYTGEGVDSNGYVHLTGGVWTDQLTAPMYDSEGHAYQYRISEGGFPHYYSTYSFHANPELSEYFYTVTNIPDGEEDDKHINLRKVWKDDGELEYRKPIQIHYTQEVCGPSGNSVQLSEGNIWQERIKVNNDFDYNKETDQGYFTELTQDEHGVYTPIEDIDLNSLREDQKWINQLLSSKWFYNSSAENGLKEIQGENEKVLFDDYAGIYKDNDHYYLVHQSFDPTVTANDTSGELTFTNTRIGIVNYEIQFDWNIGEVIDDIHEVTVKILANGQEYTTQTIPITYDLKNFYILNMPKYDKDGKIIEYTLEELTINGQPIGTNGTFTLDGNKGEVLVEPYDYQNGPDAHSDDLMKVRITNTFVDTTDFVAHKKWYDDSNFLRTRSDLYIQLWRRSTKKVNGVRDAAERVFEKDYLWERQASDTINYWTYNYDDLPKYDEKGYEYTYFIKELDMNHYKREYDNSESEHTLIVDSGNPDNSDDTEAAYNNGVVKNTLTGKVKIKGKKLWQNIVMPPSVNDANKKYIYPVANINIYKKLKYSSQTEKIGETVIENGDSNFIFHVDNDPDKPERSFDKYDSNGALISYTLSEEPIHGYAFRIVENTIINEYNGGPPIRFKVHKNWQNMDDASIYPTIRVTLHQVFTDNNGNTIEYKTYERTLRNGATDCEFGEHNELRTYAPNGTEFQYYVTERLINYLGEYVDLDNDNNSGLGFQCSIAEKVDVTPSPPQTYTMSNEETVDIKEYQDDITNTYYPDISNFHGEVFVNKSWDNKGLSEFDDVRDYTFILRRKTTKLPLTQLFELETGEGGTAPNFKSLGMGVVLTEAFQAVYGTGDDPPLSYYQAVLSIDGKPVTVKVDVQNNNKVDVKGLAVYAKDAVKYEYIIKEQPKTGYIVNGEVSGKLDQTNGQNDTERTFNLNNELDVFSINLNKVFAKTYTNSNGQTVTEPIQPADYIQFFNAAYKNRLEFTLMRKTPDTQAIPYRTVSGSQLDGDYSYTFTDLPRYDANQNPYTYYIEETGTVGNHVSIAYSSDNSSFSSSTRDIDASNAGEEKQTYVRNIFEAKEFTLNKIWDDNNNADGLRPEDLQVMITEKISGFSDVQITRTLDNPHRWTMKIALPRYYYNGDDPVGNLEYKIQETLTPELEKYGYQIVPSESDLEFNNVETADFNELKLTNRKERIDGQLNIKKSWDDFEDKWELRPSSVYVKLYREIDGEPDSAYLHVTENLFGNPIGDSNGVIQLTDSSNPVFEKLIEHLPYGTAGADATDQYNGEFKKYRYKFVECNSSGVEYTNSPSDNFPYHWEQNQGQNGTMTPDIADYETAILESNIKNTLIKENHRVTKIWDDTDNYYHTRKKYTFSLQRKIESDADWYDVPELQGGVIEVTDTSNNKVTVFENLPVYDSSGNKYYYRAIETKIGDNLANKTHTVNGDAHQATQNYWIEYDDDMTDLQTNVTNHLIPKADSLSFTAEKFWQDNGNQDFKRPTRLKVTLVQTYDKTVDGVTSTYTKRYDEYLDESNGWQYVWSGYPAYTEDGISYQYDIVEDSIPEYDEQKVSHDVGSENDCADFTNTYTPEKKDLTVIKNWTDEGNVYNIRPSNIKFVLYCKYDDYDNDSSTDTSYDGKAELSALADARYLGASYDYEKTVTGAATAVQWQTTFEDLPVWINPTGTDMINGKSAVVQYYVKEEDASQGTGSKDYDYAVSVPVDLLDNNDPTDKEVPVENKLKTRQITVYKEWDDNGYNENDNLHFHYDIDVTLTCDDINYSETKVLDANSEEGVNFNNLPKYKNGSTLQYIVTEKVSDSSLQQLHGYEFSYRVTETESTDASVVTKYTITNTLPVKRYKAQKIWDDNKNQDGKRTADLNFELSRKVGTGAFSKVDDMDAIQETWLVDFGVHPVYDEQNREDTYSITETVPSEYTSELVGGSGVETTETNGDKIVTYTYKNTYIPKIGKIPVKKIWEDEIDGKDYSSKTRPNAVQVELYCKYGSMTSFQKVSLTPKVLELLPANYELIKTVQPDSSDNWLTEYTDLPVNVNPNGTETFDGHSYPITYFVQEVYNTNLNGYTVDYSINGQSLPPNGGTGTQEEITNTLVTGEVKIKKVWNDKNYTGDNLHYAVQIQVTSNDVGYDETITVPKDDQNVVMVSKLPLYDKDGVLAEYSVLELTQKYGY